MITNSGTLIPTIFFSGMALLSITGCISDSDELKASDIYTTLERTILPQAVDSSVIVSIEKSDSFAIYGFGNWYYGSGLPYERRLDLMPETYDSSSLTNDARLLRFFAMTDIHITDEESPAQAIFFRKYLSNFAISVYSPAMLYSAQMLDAAVRTVNRLHSKQPFDLGVILGDMINNAQYNELRWFIDILDGQWIDPDSGDDDDPVEGSNNDHQDAFQAEGLLASIPWYAAIGNHDHFWIGSKPVNDRLRAVLTGDSILQCGNILSDQDAFSKRLYSMGAIDGSSPYAKIVGEGVVANMTVIPTIPADADRRAVSIDDIMEEMSNTTTLPVGHGFVQDNTANQFGGCYSFEPKAGLPLKIIVLDNTQEDTDISRIYGHGSLKNGRHEWLIQQLQAGQDENKLMIIAAHVPIGVAFGEEVGWYDEIVERNLIAELKTYPNLMLYVAGHRHLNTVKAFPSDDPEHPENSFWGVETKSLREFPQQFRTFDIFRNNDNSISIFVTNVDPALKVGSLAYVGRSYAIAAQQLYGLLEPSTGSGPVSYNAELVKPLSAEMKAVIAGY